MLREESFGFNRIFFSFTNVEAVNTINTSNFFWIWFCTFTLDLFSQFSPSFSWGIGLSWFMVLASLTLLSNLTELPQLFLPSEWASFSFCGRCAAYFLEYYSSNLHSSEECPGPCNKHVLSALVIFSLRETAFFVLRLPERPFSGLIGKADSHTFCFLT